MKTHKKIGLAALTIIIAGSLYAGRTPDIRAQQHGSQVGNQLEPAAAILCDACEAKTTAGTTASAKAMLECPGDTGKQCNTCEEVTKVVKTGPPSKGRTGTPLKSGECSGECAGVPMTESHQGHQMN